MHLRMLGQCIEMVHVLSLRSSVTVARFSPVKCEKLYYYAMHSVKL